MDSLAVTQTAILVTETCKYSEDGDTVTVRETALIPYRSIERYVVRYDDEKQLVHLSIYSATTEKHICGYGGSEPEYSEQAEIAKQIDKFIEAYVAWCLRAEL